MPIPSDDFSNMCSYCTARVGHSNLKRCGACRMVYYCSKDCQKAAWKSHKQRCAGGAKLREQLAEDEDARATHAMLVDWLKYWRTTLHHMSVRAFDLANHPHDRLATHCMVVFLERRRNPPSRAQQLKMTEGKIMSRDQFANYLRRIETPEEDVQEWLQDVRGDHTVHICVIFEDAARFLWFSLMDLTEYRNTDKERSQLIGENWASYLAVRIEKGDMYRGNE